jgi:deferrochelatase/peroxidase EfeB
VPDTGSPAKGRDRGISRRELFRLAGATGTGLALGAGGMGAVAAGSLAREQEDGRAVETHPFYGLHQAGIATPTQSRLCFAAFDVTSEDREEVRDLLREWSGAAAKMCAGEPLQRLA